MNKSLLVLALAVVVIAACTSPMPTPPPAATLAPTNPPPIGLPATQAPQTTLPASDTPAPGATTHTPIPPDTHTPAPSATPAILTPGAFDPADYTFAPVAGGFSRPVLVTHAGDGSGRLFVVEQDGAIRVVTADGAVLPQPFLDRRGQVSRAYEQGLLGLAFHPHYGANGAFFIYYTDLAGDTQVERCQVSEQDPNQANPESCTRVLSVDQPYGNHNGGHLGFGPDGYLYVGLGDGGSAGDPQRRAQNPNSLLGKLLRLNISGDEAPYGVPPDNPYVGRTDARWEIWASGLRNPWRWSFDRATGDLYIGDVGQNAYEEVNFQPAGSPGGENYGWHYYEGLHRFSGEPNDPPAGLALTAPIVEYAQAATGGCSVTGGYVYRGPSLPELNGLYFYADFCAGTIWVLRPSADSWQNLTWAQTRLALSSFGEDEAGELYVCDLSGGGIYRLTRQ
jgi:glucose/arabinose dehydrogenase